MLAVPTDELLQKAEAPELVKLGDRQLLVRRQLEPRNLRKQLCT